MQRIASVIGLPAENAAVYEKLHREVWPGVLERLRQSNVRNYSIYRHGELLFSYMEYIGDDLETDLAAIADDPTTQEWWALCMPLQRPLPDRRAAEWWKEIPEVFHMA